MVDPSRIMISQFIDHEVPLFRLRPDAVRVQRVDNVPAGWDELQIPAEVEIFISLTHLTYDSLDKTTLAVAAVKLMLAPAAAETTLGIFLYAASRLPSSCETELASLFDDCPWS